MHRLLLAAAIAVAPVAAFGQAARDNIDALIEQQAKANGVPASFVHAVVKRESNYNPNAKGGSALGLMQIKHATARGMGYGGDSAGLYDPATNLRYGVAYLAGAYRAAQGNLSQAYRYYNQGYYYAAKRQGISTQVAEVVAPVAASASAVASLFTGGAPAAAGSSPALAYAAAPTETVEVPLPPRRPAAFGAAEIAVAAAQPEAPAAASAAVTVAAVEVPLPPRRPDGLGGAAQVTDAAPVQVAELRLSLEVAAQAAPAAETVAVPLPPRRPSVQRLAAAMPRRAPAAAPVQEAAALPVE